MLSSAVGLVGGTAASPRGVSWNEAGGFVDR